MPIVFSNRSTWSDSLTLIDPIVRKYFGCRGFPRMINWHFSGFAFGFTHYAVEFPKPLRVYLHNKPMCYCQQNSKYQIFQ